MKYGKVILTGLMAVALPSCIVAADSQVLGLSPVVAAMSTPSRAGALQSGDSSVKRNRYLRYRRILDQTRKLIAEINNRNSGDQEFWRFAIRCLNDNEFVIADCGIFIVDALAHADRRYVPVALSMIEQTAVRTSAPLDKTTCLKQYMALLLMSSKAPSAAPVQSERADEEDSAMLNRVKANGRLDAGVRSYVAKRLAGGDLQSDVAPIDILVSSIRLGRDDRMWGQQTVSRQIKKSGSRESRLFWTVVSESMSGRFEELP